MAGSADITGRQNYVAGIGHPKTTPNNEAAPAMVQTNLAGGLAFQAGSQVIPAMTQINRRIGFAMLGQSNERGNGLRYVAANGAASDPNAYSNTYSRSIADVSIFDPVAPSTRGQYSMIPQLVDRLAARAIQAKAVNCAIGSLSFIGQVTGQAGSWGPNKAFYQQRPAVLAGDAGDKGELILVGTRLWRCTTGNKMYAFFNDPVGLTLYTPGGSTGQLSKSLDYIQIDQPNASLLKTSGTQPAGLSTNGSVGDTVTDGAIVWTRVTDTAGVDYTSFNPYPYTCPDFDRLGVLARLKTNLDAMTGVDEKWVFFANGQSDVQGSVGVQPTIQNWYKTCLQNICDWVTSNGYRAAIGFTCANPGDEAGGLGYRWQTLDAAWAQACAAKVNGTTVIAGGNLYRALGLSPKVFPQPGLPYGIHLTNEGQKDAAAAWDAALQAGGL